MSNNSKIEICESYKDFRPHSWVRRSVTRLIDGVPEKYVNGLHCVILTNTDGLTHRRRRQKTVSRKRKVSVIECRGLYHRKWQGKPATIELFVDKIIHRWPDIILKVPLFQDLLLADVLYHEIGHHVHKTIAPEHREREDVAEDWQKKLGRHYFRQKYKWLKPFRIILKPIVALLLKLVRLIQRETKHKEKHFWDVVAIWYISRHSFDLLFRAEYHFFQFVIDSYPALAQVRLGRCNYKS